MIKHHLNVYLHLGEEACDRVDFTKLWTTYPERPRRMNGWSGQDHLAAWHLAPPRLKVERATPLLRPAHTR